MFDKERNLADEYYEYKQDNVTFTHLVGLDAIYYYISLKKTIRFLMLIMSLLFFKDFLTNTSLPRRAGAHLSMESVIALAGQTMISNL